MKRKSATLIVSTAILCAGVGLVWVSTLVNAGEPAVAIPAPVVDEEASGLQTAVFAGGCFWGVQAVFQHTEGVADAVSGYAGGKQADPKYRQVSAGTTGHAEAVEITYDAAKISYGKLLQIFFSVAHDPTQLDRQGPDVGTQYRSAIFATNDEQRRVAKAYVDQLGEAGVYAKPIVTEISPLNAFYRAEDYHQDYATLHPNQPYIVYNDLPKIANLARGFPEVWRERPKLVFGASGGS